MADDKLLQLGDLLRYIISNHDPSIQHLFYFGIGSASNLTQKRVSMIERRDMHQYPPFIEYIHENYGVRLHLILIDAYLSSPPYIVTVLQKRDINEHMQYNRLNKSNQNIANMCTNVHDIGNITVYEFKENVEYIGCITNNRQINDCSIDITEMLHEFNDWCNETRNLLAFHDFSGRNTWMVAEYFDQFVNRSSFILYDITLRRDGTCSIDLEDDIIHLHMRVINDKVQFVNPYQLPSMEALRICKSSKNVKYSTQTEYFIKRKIHLFKKEVYSILRRLINHRNELNKKHKENSEMEKFGKNVRKNEFFIHDIISGYHICEIMFRPYINMYLGGQIEEAMEILDQLIHILYENVKKFIKINFKEFYNDNKVKFDDIHNDLYEWVGKYEQKIKNWLISNGLCQNDNFNYYAFI
jgi:hypothetical protein